jgi:heme ABC exporter ATP-binding subunit CcmA
VLSVDRVTKRFGHTAALEDVSFIVNEGETFALLGPNGSGKTTLLKLMVGLNVPTEGEISVHGVDVRRRPVEACRHVSYLPQRASFPEVLSAEEILRFYCRLRSIPSGEAGKALARVGFNGFGGKPVGEFSGGMLQRLGLAVMMLPDAPILLLDEPTANLDLHGAKRFREFIHEEKGKGKTIVFSTHVLEEAEELADRVGIFVGGRLLAQESVGGLQSTYRAVRTIEDVYLYYVEHHGTES